MAAWRVTAAVARVLESTCASLSRRNVFATILVVVVMVAFVCGRGNEANGGGDNGDDAELHLHMTSPMVAAARIETVVVAAAMTVFVLLM